MRLDTVVRPDGDNREDWVQDEEVEGVDARLIWGEFIVPPKQSVESNSKEDDVHRVCRHVREYLNGRSDVVGAYLDSWTLQCFDSLVLSVECNCGGERERDNITRQVKDQWQAEADKWDEHQQNLLEERDLKKRHLIMADIEQL